MQEHICRVESCACCIEYITLGAGALLGIGKRICSLYAYSGEAGKSSARIVVQTGFKANGNCRPYKSLHLGYTYPTRRCLC